MQVTIIKSFFGHREYTIISFFNLNLLCKTQENQSASHVTLQKEDNCSSAYVGLIYSQFYNKGLILVLFRKIKKIK